MILLPLPPQTFPPLPIPPFTKTAFYQLLPLSFAIAPGIPLNPPTLTMKLLFALTMLYGFPLCNVNLKV